jgi:hypothetical protein
MGVCVGRRLSIAICVACVGLLQVPALADQALRPPTNTPAPEAPTNSRTKEVLTDAAIIAALIAASIAASIAAYRAGGPGPCACPEDTDRAGHRCGRRSAHDKPGGWDVACYPSDITKEAIDAYRKSQGK